MDSRTVSSSFFGPITHSLCYERSCKVRDALPLIQFSFKGLTIPVKEWQVYVLVYPHVTELCIVRMSSRFQSRSSWQAASSMANSSVWHWRSKHLYKLRVSFNESPTLTGTPLIDLESLWYHIVSEESSPLSQLWEAGRTRVNPRTSRGKVPIDLQSSI